MKVNTRLILKSLKDSKCPNCTTEIQWLANPDEFYCHWGCFKLSGKGLENVLNKQKGSE